MGDLQADYRQAGGKMTGMICIHLGDELEFVAKKAKAPDGVKRSRRGD
jgi:hypothetical protein